VFLSFVRPLSVFCFCISFRALVYTEPADMARSVMPKFRKRGAELMVVVSDPNDVKLAETVGLVDIILGGWVVLFPRSDGRGDGDYHHAHQLVNGVHVIRSGYDFK